MPWRNAADGLFTKSLLAFKTPVPYLTVATAAFYLSFSKISIPVNVYIMLILGVIIALNLIVADETALRRNLPISHQHQGFFLNPFSRGFMTGEAGSDCSPN